jgi:hypothetical protein
MANFFGVGDTDGLATEAALAAEIESLRGSSTRSARLRWMTAG